MTWSLAPPTALATLLAEEVAWNKRKETPIVSKGLCSGLTLDVSGGQANSEVCISPQQAVLYSAAVFAAHRHRLTVNVQTTAMMMLLTTQALCWRLLHASTVAPAAATAEAETAGRSMKRVEGKFGGQHHVLLSSDTECVGCSDR